MTPEQFQEALRDGDEHAVARALADFRFEVLGRNDVAEPHASVLLEDDARTILAFTSRATADLMRHGQRLLPVRGANLPGLAEAYAATRIRVDPAGPAGASFDVSRWQALLDGVIAGEKGTSVYGLTVAAWEDISVPFLELLRTGGRDGVRMLVFRRVVGDRSVPAVSVDGPDADEADIARIAALLGGRGGFDHVDVLLLDTGTADRVETVVKNARVR